jgi:thiosulfate/3-mercaptopyruvate sulfurtransferase
LSETLPRLLEPEQLASILHPGLSSPELMLIHVTDAPAYHQAHLPGALLVEPRALVSGTPPAPGRLPEKPQLEALFSRLGYRPDLHIVAYDDEGGGWAGRLIWTLDIIGHTSWSYLDGGIHAWHGAGLPLASGAAPQPAPTAVSLTLDRAPIAEREDVLAAIGDPAQLIWDVRSAEEYRGERSGARRAGHIPTALNLDWMALKDPARQLRLTQNLPELLAAHGIDPDKRIITHCQTHHRSALSYLVGRLLGFREIRGYHGSWADWGNADDTPIVTGPNPGETPAGWRAATPPDA